MTKRAHHVCFLGSDHTIHLPRWLRHFAGRGWRVSFIGTDTQGLDDIDGVELRVLPCRGGVLWRLVELRNALRALAPDIVNVHGMHRWCTAAWLSGRTPVVLAGWGHDIFYDAVDSRLHRWFIRAAAQRASLVHSISPDMTRVMVEVVGIPANKIVTQPWGCDTAVFRRLPVEAPDGKLRVITTRGFQPVYNWDIMLRAAVIACRQEPRLEVVWPNDGPDLEQARALHAALGGEPRIRLLGRQPTEVLVRELNRAQVFVTVSRSDGNNISLNEAMACGCLPVCSDIPANTQWVTDRENGLVVKNLNPETLAAAILRAVRDRAWQERARPLNARIVNERADFARNLDRMAERYRMLITKKLAGVG